MATAAPSSSMWRQGALALALIATLIASFVDFSEPELVQPRQREPVESAAGSDDAPATPESRAAPTTREQHVPQEVDLFAAHSWQRLLPVEPRPAPPPITAPRVPPLPFRYLGQLFDGRQRVLFVGQGARSHLLREGDVLEQYRLVQITAQQATFVYLPRNQRQTLEFTREN
ncbi:MAG TPA: hypothetical protein PKC34_11575 [Pseudomonadales bacterium]|nr:hypothetical protein [Pseudomonadales bacterium]HMW16171.1 hypothetical protein [Pseudomonadales bacterium]HMW84344.1 hypothetical protein [Pseudomonadales bacterium]HMZ72021.1 hypothetical protein [Pseudomonadales bacterium]HND28285.1 hypothetical protein [Pseudomonadales bacterium]